MKRIFAIAALAASPWPAHAAERVFTVTSYDRVRVEGPYQVDIVTGRGSAARATGAREALDRIDLEVQGQTLVIRTDRTGWTGGWPGEAKSGPVTIRLSAGELRAASLSGSGRLAIDRVRGPRITLAVEGSGQMTIGRVETDRLDVALLGSGGLAMAGAVKSLDARVRGSAGIDGAALVANDLVLATESAGDVALGAKLTAKVTATGSGRTVIGGKPACTVNAIGSGEVICGAAE